MTEQEWLVSTDPQAMLRFLMDGGDGSGLYRERIASDPKLRLFACACWSYLGRDDVEGNMADAFNFASYEQEPPKNLQSVILRDIFGNPFRPIRCLCGGATPSQICSQRDAVLAWNDGTVGKIAQAIYDERRFEDMPILADALEDSGCSNTDILNHCRDKSCLVRGCWAIDLLLGKD